LKKQVLKKVISKKPLTNFYEINISVRMCYAYALLVLNIDDCLSKDAIEEWKMQSVFYSDCSDGWNKDIELNWIKTFKNKLIKDSLKKIDV